MKPADDVEKFVNNAGIDTNPKMDETVLDKVLTAHKNAEHVPNLRSIIMKSPITKIAAVLFLIAGICITCLHGKAAWAQVVEAFNKATDVHIVKQDITANGLSITAVEAWIKNQTLFRAEAQDWRVVDDGRNVLTLYKNDRIAHIRESFTPYWDYTPLILKVFRDMESENGIQITSLPQESTEDTLVYQIDFRDYWQGKAWVDAASSLPMQIVGRENEDGGWTRNFEITFDYEPIPDETFDTAIPLGFTNALVHKHPLDFISPLVHTNHLGFKRNMVHKRSLIFTASLVHSQKLDFTCSLVHSAMMDFIFLVVHISGVDFSPHMVHRDIWFPRCSWFTYPGWVS